MFGWCPIGLGWDHGPKGFGWQDPIELGSLVDPQSDRIDGCLGEWFAIERHAQIGLGVFHPNDPLALRAFGRNDWVGPPIAWLDQLLDGIETIASLGFFRAVASDAML